MARFTVHTDGSCHGNPGPGGYAAIIEGPGEQPTTISGGDPATTSNRMEMTAVIRALEYVANLTGADQPSIAIFTDSEYVCKGFNAGWIAGWQRRNWRTAQGNPVANQELWKRMLLLTQTASVTFNHVPGHAGVPLNEECDRIANQEASAAATLSNPTHRVHDEPLDQDPADRPSLPQQPDDEYREAYQRGYTEGFDAARATMATALASIPSPTFVQETPENPAR